MDKVVVVTPPEMSSQSADATTDTEAVTLHSYTVTKVTVHLPPTATRLLGECTVPPHALLLASSDVPYEVN